MKYEIRDLTLAECRVEPKEWMELYRDGKHNELAVKILEILAALAKPKNCFVAINSQTQHFIDSLCKNIGYFFTQPDFFVSDESLKLHFLAFNTLLSNLFELSSFGAADSFIKQLVYQPNNLHKLLTLYSSKSNIDANYSSFMGTGDERSVGSWYGAFLYGVSALNPAISRRVNIHLQNPPTVLPNSVAALAGYFQCTYLEPELDRNYKGVFNASIKERLKGVEITNTPNKRKIAIVSASWRATHVTYKSISPYIKALSQKYHLTLVCLGKDRIDEIERSLFKSVLFVSTGSDGNIDISQIAKNDFSLVLYPDVGLDIESRLLSNVRIAPYQTAMYGFPVSTFGSEIDFFVGGEDVESKSADENYSERLVRVKGIGSIPVKREFAPEGEGGGFDNKRVLFLGSYQKLNFGVIDALSELKDEASEFVFVAQSGVLRNQSYLPTLKALKAKLGEKVELNPELSYEAYMQKLHSATICLDSYPFGGFNTIMDALHLGKPVVTWEGTKAYNRLASAVLRRVGLNELIATSKEEYVAIAKRLLGDREFYNRVCEHIKSLDIDSLLFTRDDELDDFLEKIGMIIDGKIAKKG